MAARKSKPELPPAEGIYHERDCDKFFWRSLINGTTVGFGISALRNHYETHNHGWKGVFTRTGGTIGFFATIAGVYAVTECTSANLRQKDDHWNAALGGCAVGALTGLRARSGGLAIGGCLGFGGALALYQYLDGLFGPLHGKSPEEILEFRRENRWK